MYQRVIGASLAWLLSSVVEGGKVSAFDPMRVHFTQLTPKTWATSLIKFRSEGQSQAVLFYTHTGDVKKYIEEIYDPLTEQLTNVVKFMAIDCELYQKHCKEQLDAESYKDAPVVITYPPLPRPVQILSSKPSLDDIRKAVLKVVPRENVSTLTAATFDSFVEDPLSVTIPKILFFGDKKQAPPTFHAIANAMHDRVNFAYVNVSEEGNDKVKVRILGKNTKTPKLAMYKSKKIEIYPGNVTNGRDVFDWVNIHAETFVKGGGFAASEAPKQPWLTETIPKMTKDSHGAICFKLTALCAIYATPNPSLSEEETKMLESLIAATTSSNAADAKLKFSWLAVNDEKKAAAALNVSEIKTPHFLIINTNKRLRFTTPVEASKDVILKQIENLNAGNQRFTVIKGKKIPTFVSRSGEVGNEGSSPHDEL